MLTWSLGWASSPARLAITSLAFMFEEVPEPVWKTSTGNWSSCSPSATAWPAAAICAARSASSWPSAPFASAAADLIRPSQRTTGTGTRSPETGKLSTALVVSPPHNCSLKAASIDEVLGSGRVLAGRRERLAVGATGREALAVGGEELLRQRLAARRIAGRDGQPADEVGVDPFAL